MIKFGSLNVKDIRIGEQQVKKVAVGSEVIWEKSVSPLPSGYTQVKYLQSSGTQYLKTTIIPTNDIKVEVSYQKLQAGWGTPEFIFAERNSSNQNAFGLGYYTNQNPLVSWLSSFIVVKNQFSSSEVDCIIDVKEKSITFTQDNQTTVIAIGSGSLNTTFPLYVFARNSGGTTNNIARIKLMKFKIYDNDILQMNLLPCLDTNNTPCFYDTVTQQTFYNAGTGEFGYETMDGTVVVPT